MSAGKGQPTPPTDGTADPLLLAAADLREAAAELRDKAAELGQRLAAVDLERRAHADLVAERDRLIGENHEHQKAVLLLLDQLFQTSGGQHAAGSKETTDVH